MLNPKLKDRYEVTDRVTAPIFRNAILGVIDLSKIGEEVAEKLVKSGHLKKVAPKKKAEKE